jgi:hypothetical protein
VNFFQLFVYVAAYYFCLKFEISYLLSSFPSFFLFCLSSFVSCVFSDPLIGPEPDFQVNGFQLFMLK